MSKLYPFRLYGFKAYWDTSAKKWVAVKEDIEITADSREEIYKEIEKYGK